MKRYLLVFCFAIAFICKAQNFNYTISLDSSFNYTALSGATVLSPNSKWLPRYEIPTGFDSGAAFPQTLILETNGFLIYNQKFNSAVMAFSGFHCKTDSNSTFSQLSYLTTGSPGSKVVKVEFKNVGQSDAPAELVSYQVWLKENGVIEIVVGDNTYQPLPGSIDTNQVVHLGLINRNMDAATNGLFISGTPQVPVSSPVNGEHPDFTYLRTVPKKGYKYTFTPISN